MYLFHRWFYSSGKAQLPQTHANSLNGGDQDIENQEHLKLIQNRQAEHPATQYGWITQVISFLILFTGAMLVGFSRFALGVHSAN